MMICSKILLAVVVTVAVVVSGLVQAEGIRSDGVVTEHFQPEDALYKSPIHMAMNRDGSLLFVVCEKADSVQIIDTKTISGILFELETVTIPVTGDSLFVRFKLPTVTAW